MNLLSILLQATTGGSGWSGMIMIVLLFVIMYFFMIRPQQKQRKEVEKQRAGLRTGDKVITAGGVHGKLKEINDTNYVIEIAEGVKIKIDKASVFAVREESQSNK
ncbi:MAG: preprotein translocase subunit YajC [Candidatus Symbiothrix sp.]|jgi:preprotein translocase subunit YajC|nr:preprotein translocase subunit YajC [Candidatus Symbiothrix sp.]